MSLKKTSNVFVLAIFLCCIGAVAAACLSFFDMLTKEPIKNMERKKVEQTLQEVLPKFDNNPAECNFSLPSVNDKSIEVEFFGAMMGKKLAGVAGKSKTMKGYSGEIQAIVGLNPDGKIRTVIITKQNETPGLGTVVCGREREVTIWDVLGMGKKQTAGLPPNRILDSYDGHAASSDAAWKVKKDGGQFDYMSGATISSRAVCDVVYRIARTYFVNKKQIDAALKKKAAEGGAAK